MDAISSELIAIAKRILKAVESLYETNTSIAEYAKAAKDAADRKQSEPVRVEAEFSPKIIQTYQSHEDSSYRLRKRTFWVGLVTLIVLAIYTAFTCLLWQSSRDSLRLSQRSWVGVPGFNFGEDHPGQDIPLGQQVRPNAPMTANLWIENFGKTPAYIDQLGYILEVRSTPVPEDFQYKAPKNAGVIFPTQKFKTANADDVAISESDLRAITLSTQPKRLVFHGIIQYHDAFGKHVTKFCLMWGRVSTMFNNCLEHNGAE